MFGLRHLAHYRACLLPCMVAVQEFPHMHTKNSDQKTVGISTSHQSSSLRFKLQIQVTKNVKVGLKYHLHDM